MDGVRTGCTRCVYGFGVSVDTPKHPYIRTPPIRTQSVHPVHFSESASAPALSTRTPKPVQGPYRPVHRHISDPYTSRFDPYTPYRPPMMMRQSIYFDCRKTVAAVAAESVVSSASVSVSPLGGNRLSHRRKGLQGLARQSWSDDWRKTYAVSRKKPMKD
jgi:hypothetical protein